MAYVPNKPLREAFERSEASATDLALWLGYRRTGARADGGQVLRMLGIKPTSGGHFKTRLEERTALEYAEALGLDPFEINL